MLKYSKSTMLYLYNFFIENGNFANLKKSARSIYDDLLKNKPAEYKEMSLPEYLEATLLPHRKISNLDARYLKYLYAHYSKKESLVGASISQALETRLRNTAVLLSLTVEEVKQAMDDNLLFPELITHMKHRLNVRAYNALLTSITISALSDLRRYPDINLQVLANFETFEDLKEGEPRIAEFILSRIPEYGGVRKVSKDVMIILERSRYYGVNLNLDKIKSLYDDLMYALRGYFYNVNITPYISYRLRKMLKLTGNLNRIGFDSWNLLRDLDLLTLNTGFDSIKELLENEGFVFNPVNHAHATFIPSTLGFELFLDSYSDAQILVDPVIKKGIEEMDVTNSLSVDTLTLDDGNEVSLLTYMYKDNLQLAHSILTKRNDLSFKNRNSLDLTSKNLLA